GLNYFVMKYISGTSLEELLEKRQPLPFDYIQRVLWEAACALGHAHQRGVVHRDVKPANIMFDHESRVMLTDFGISKALQAAAGWPEQPVAAPARRATARAPRAPRVVTADTPTEVTSAPTARIPTAPRPKPGARPAPPSRPAARKSRTALVAGVIAALGVLG